MSMLQDFLQNHGISKESVVAASNAIERWSLEERSLMVVRAKARRDKKTYAELNLAKPKSRGRGLTLAMVERALAGGAVGRLIRQKIVRAVNASLTTAKKEQVDWRPLFGDARVRRGKKAKKKA